jgi:hypothetical protein
MEPHLWRSAGRHADAWIVSSAIYRASNLPDDPDRMALVKRLSKRVMMCAVSMEPVEAVFCLGALTKLGVRNAVAQRRLAERALPHIHQLSAALLPTLAWSTAVAVPGHYDVLNAVAEAALARQAQLEPRHISALAWAFATAGHKKVALFQALHRRALQQLEDFEPCRLAVLLWASSRLMHVSEPLYQRAGELAAAWAQAFDTLGLCNMAWAFAKAGVFPPAFFGAALPALAAAAGRGEMGGHQPCRLLWALGEYRRQQAALQASEATVAELLGSGGQGQGQAQQEQQPAAAVGIGPLVRLAEQQICTSPGQFSLTSLALAGLALCVLEASSSPALGTITAEVRARLQQQHSAQAHQQRPQQRLHQRPQQQQQQAEDVGEEEEGQEWNPRAHRPRPRPLMWRTNTAVSRAPACSRGCNSALPWATAPCGGSARLCGINLFLYFPGTPPAAQVRASLTRRSGAAACRCRCAASPTS